MDMQSKIIEIDGVQTHYLQMGEGDPLLILHGWGSSAQVMQALAVSLSEKNTCYVLDFPGFGKSGIPQKAWSLDDYTRFTSHFIEQVIGQETSVLAHSFGGRIVWKMLAGKWSLNWIKRVLVTGGAGIKPKRSWKFYLKKYTAKILKAPFQILPKSLKEKGLNNLRQTALWKSLGSSDYQQLQGVMREIFVKTVSEYADDLLPEIRHEIFLLWGKNDDATPWYQAEKLNKGIKNSSLVGIEGAGHYAFLDNPTAFYAIAKAYLNPTK